MISNWTRVLELFGLASLPEREAKSLLRAFFTDLQYRVGADLSSGLSDEQVSEFSEICRYVEGRNLAPRDDPSLAWVEEMCPNYRHVVEVNIRFLVGELYEKRERIARIADVELGSICDEPVVKAVALLMNKE